MPSPPLAACLQPLPPTSRLEHDSTSTSIAVELLLDRRDFGIGSRSSYSALRSAVQKRNRLTNTHIIVKYYDNIPMNFNKFINLCLLSLIII